MEEVGFEHARLVTEGGNANYRIEIVSADERGFRATATAVVDFDGDGVYNVWGNRPGQGVKGNHQRLTAMEVLLLWPLLVLIRSDFP